MKKFILALSLGIFIASIPMVIAVSLVFKDVQLDSWYGAAVKNLSEKGIIQGYSDNTFRPTQNVNRAELAVTLDRLIKHIEEDNAEGGGFDDCNKIVLYQNQTWFNKVDLKYQNEFLKPQELQGTLRGQEFGEGCLSSDKSLFVFIPELLEFGCGKIFTYNINSDILKTPDLSFSAPSYCASELGKRIDNYIIFRGFQADGKVCTEYTGKYYFQDNKIEVVKSICNN